MGTFTAFKSDTYPALPFPPLPGDPTFSIDAARTLTWASQLAYESDDAEKRDSILEKWGWRLMVPILVTLEIDARLKSTKGFIARWNGILIVSFAGTEPDNVVNWATNFTALKDASGLHDGFKAGVVKAWDKIIAELKGSEPIYFCGHSLGAALAAIAAHKFMTEQPEQGDRVRGVYTIGMPRIGDATFADAYNARLGSRTFRLVHGRDIVPQVPFYLALGYRHVGLPLACAPLGSFDANTLPKSVQAESLSMQDAGQEEAQFASVENEIARFESNVSKSLQKALDLLQGLLPGGGPVFPSDKPWVSVAASTLPGCIRDHLADRYLQALGALPH